MGYESFKEELLDTLRQKAGEGKKIMVRKVEKNNGIEEEAVMILSKGGRIAPAIYLREFFESWEKAGESTEEIAVEILAQNAYQEKEVDFSLDCFDNYEKARGQVYFKLINYEMNKVLLTKVPYIAYLDLAIVFYYRLE